MKTYPRKAYSRQNFCTFLLIPSVLIPFSYGYAQEELSTKEIKNRIDLNNAKLSDGSFQVMKVSVTDNGFFTTSDDQKKYAAKNRISGKKVVILRENTKFSGKKEVNATNVTQLEIKNTLINRSVVWKDNTNNSETTLVDEADGIGDDGEVVVANHGDQFVESGEVTYASTLPTLLVGPDAPTILEDYVLKGKTTFRGLECLKLIYSSADQSFSREVLVCPACDYRIVSMESKHVFADAGLQTIITSTVTVEKIKKVDDLWIPALIREQETKVGPDQLATQRVSQLKVIDFQPNSLTVNALFEPLVTPGTIVINTANRLAAPEVVGGDISSLMSQLREGDFSYLEEVKGDLIER